MFGFGKTATAQTVLTERYLLRDDTGEVAESIDACIERVAQAVAQAESPAQRKLKATLFADLIRSGRFCPNSPTLMNAGRASGQLAACFVLPIEDDIRGIFETLKDAAWIQQSGGGTGFSFGRLRHHGDVVKSTFGAAAGPIGFLKVFDQATESVKQGGARRGANMGILPVSHPDILEFIQCKNREGAIRNFNLSVAVTTEFMRAVEASQEWKLVNPRDGEVVEVIPTAELFEQIAVAAWTNGEPGLVFIDRINEDNPTPELGMIESTNPCGEQPLLPYEACNLGSINLAAFVDPTRKTLNWKELESTIELSVRFLDNVIDVNCYPLPQIEHIVKLNRKIGLGLMGLADTFILLGIPYDSSEALKLAHDISKQFATFANKASERLGKERGYCPQWLKMNRKDVTLRRNATVTTVAPTGTISLIMGCSPGIEPVFSFITERHILDGDPIIDVHPLFEKMCKEHKLDLSTILKWLHDHPGSTSPHLFPQLVNGPLWKTATAIEWKIHLEMQGIFQDFMDNGVSKTINLPSTASVDTVKDVYVHAWKRRLKGITVYRHLSRDLQSQSLPSEVHETCGTPLMAMEGCLYCPFCHVSLCGSE